MLGLIYKIYHGRAQAKFNELFTKEGMPEYHRRQSLRRPRHNKQLYDICNESRSDLMHRSIFGMITVWNRLPERVVNADSVVIFQKLLTADARNKSRAQERHLSKAFSGCLP